MMKRVVAVVLLGLLLVLGLAGSGAVGVDNGKAFAAPSRVVTLSDPGLDATNPF